MKANRTVSPVSRCCFTGSELNSVAFVPSQRELFCTKIYYSFLNKMLNGVLPR
jgi:hypothetical protein